jgi:putative redox protein
MRLKLTQTGPRRMEARTDKWTLVVDLREEFGGEGSGPNPSELLVAAVASCETLTGVYWASRRHDIELSGLEAEVEWQYERDPERISKIGVAIRNVAAQLEDEAMTRAFRGVARACTITRTLQHTPELAILVE